MKSQPSPLVRISATLKKQHGAITKSQGLQYLTLGEWRNLVDRRVLVPSRRHGGVSRLSGSRETWLQQAWSAHLALPGSLLSHRSAAKLFGIRRFDHSEAWVELTVAHSGARPSSRQIRLHRTRRPDVGIVHGDSSLPITTPERTVIDLAGIVPKREVPRILELFVHLRLTNHSKLQEYVEAIPLDGRRNGRFLSSLIKAGPGKAENLESSAEERALRLFRLAGLNPVPQFEVSTTTGNYRLDFAFPLIQLAVEIDGPHHAEPDQARHDRQRDTALSSIGWRVVRTRIHDDLSFVVDQVRAALSAVDARCVGQ